MPGLKPLSHFSEREAQGDPNLKHWATSLGVPISKNRFSSLIGDSCSAENDDRKTTARFDVWGGESLSCLGDQVDGAEDAGGDGLDFVEVLHLETVAVFFDEGFVIVGWEFGPGVEGGVVDVDFDVVLAGL